MEAFLVSQRLSFRSFMSKGHFTAWFQNGLRHLKLSWFLKREREGNAEATIKESSVMVQCSHKFLNFLYHRLARCILNLELEVRLKWAPHRNSGGSGRTPSVCRHKTSHHGDWNYQEVSKALCFSTSMFWKIFLKWIRRLIRKATFLPASPVSKVVPSLKYTCMKEPSMQSLKRPTNPGRTHIRYPRHPSIHLYIYIYIYITIYRHLKSQLLKFRIFMISAHSANPRFEEASPESM